MGYTPDAARTQAHVLLVASAAILLLAGRPPDLVQKLFQVHGAMVSTYNTWPVGGLQPHVLPGALQALHVMNVDTHDDDPNSP